jgi:hypothetical protein
MSERQTAAPPVPARSLNLLDASVDDLSATLIARLVTGVRGGCGTFSCGTFGRVRQAQESEAAD